MVLIFMLISLAEGIITFLSPDDLRSITLRYAIPIFTKIEFTQRYGKLVFANITKCEIEAQLSNDDVMVAFSNDIDKCNLYDLAKSTKSQGGGAFLAVASEFFLQNQSFYEWENDIYYNHYTEEYVYHSDDIKSLDIFCLVLLDAHSILKDYLNKPSIWIQYSYKQFLRTNSPNFEFAVTSDFYRIDLFFTELLEFCSKMEIYIYNLDLFFVYDKATYYYSDEKYDEVFDGENCIMINVNSNMNVSYCIYPSNEKGYERLLAIIMVLNYYYSFLSIDYAHYFVDFLSKLYFACHNEYLVSCINSTLVSSNIVPSLDPYVLFEHSREIYVPDYTYSINGVFIYTRDYMEKSYIISNKKKSKICKAYIDECDDGCSYENLLDLQCSKKCNTTLCGFDNLICLQADECFHFMLGDGYCNSMCPSDPDCSSDKSSNDNDYLLIVVIIISIICGILL